MCPIHWATFAFAALPAALGLVGFFGLRMRRRPDRPWRGEA
jgi:hypothetical protein